MEIFFLDADPSLLTSQIEQSTAGQPDSPMAEPMPQLLGQPTQVDDDEEDEDELKKAMAALGRGKSYCEHEDFLIAKAWAAVSEDGRNGVGNKSEVFQDKVKKHVHTLVAENNEDATAMNSNLGLIPIRNGKSIWCRWNNHHHVVHDHTSIHLVFYIFDIPMLDRPCQQLELPHQHAKCPFRILPGTLLPLHK